MWLRPRRREDDVELVVVACDETDRLELSLRRFPADEEWACVTGLETVSKEKYQPGPRLHSGFDREDGPSRKRSCASPELEAAESPRSGAACRCERRDEDVDA